MFLLKRQINMTTADHLIHHFFVVAGLRSNSIHLPEGILTAARIWHSQDSTLCRGRTAIDTYQSSSRVNPFW